jgi:hypothetical protein
MKYIVSEEELSNIVAKCMQSHSIQTAWDTLNDFLKSKKPVEEIASGEVVTWLENEGGIGNIFVNQRGKEKINLISIADFIPQKYWKKLKGKSIKIYIVEE